MKDANIKDLVKVLQRKGYRTLSSVPQEILVKMGCLEVKNSKQKWYLPTPRLDELMKEFEE